MPSLALETSGRTGSVAICADDGSALALQTFEHGLRHAAMLLPIIDGLCRDLHLEPGDLDPIFVSTGPGSFTGLRIGVTLAKTLAFATGAKLVAVPSARVLAGNAPADAVNVAVVLDAKRGQIFSARFRRDGGVLVEVEPPHLGTLAAVIERAPKPLHLIGEGIPFHADAARAEGVIVCDESTWTAKAEIVARIGIDLARQGQFTDPFKLVPLYIRLPEAEEKRRAALNN